MTTEAERALSHLEALTAGPGDRRPGSEANRAATDYVARAFEAARWQTSTPEFYCLDWRTDGGSVAFDGIELQLTPAPYGLGVSATGPIRVLSTLGDLQRTDIGDAVLVLTGELAAEPLTPKEYPFYRSEEHARIVVALETAAPAAVIGVTGRAPALCGALDPFPLIEDGDFTIPAANVRPQDAAALLEADGKPANITIRSKRIPTRAQNVIGRRGPQAHRVTVMAHIDAKPGTPGAVDNAAGVVALLLLADRLSAARHPMLPTGLELLAVNGEDHFAAPGEVAWLKGQDDRLDDIALAINIDAAGYRLGRSSYSTYNLDEAMTAQVRAAFGSHPGLVEGPDWFQSDHAIFAMRGRAAVAITAERLDELLAELYHSPADTADQVDVERLVEVADAIEALIMDWPS